MLKRHRIQFPKSGSSNLNQDEAYFYLQGSGGHRKIRFHDYDEIYQVQGLYEQVFYDRLKCTSPSKVTSILKSSVMQSHDNFTELRVLDLGAGNGMMGEELKKHGVSRLIGVDIIPEAYEATVRDRPGLYDAYYVENFTTLSEEKKEDIASWQCDCMVTVAALGFGDIPTKAFIEAFNIIKEQGWVAFNIKESFFDASDESGFSKMIRELIFSKYIDVYHIERYKHRLSIEGEPLYYFAIAGRKNGDVPSEFLESKGILA
ncbi:MAG: methyltransferase domain-containing protein [gamma proteobacterium endosymbiont of Lamellibrachia anaximandri]|nr:methyltransferase domain-containing protein [gamma proteobacterium endosymbiont of Lamellibrachia anaximandri]MBL3619712.1 methyltransferase domain-containing protein [gamma proteobacterium endosymbiont of Lamellibrachia anaximandri]